MAQVPINKCLERIPNPFALTLVATKRARQLARGAPSRLPMDRHGAAVEALREIAAGLVTYNVLDEPDLPEPLPPWLASMQDIDPDEGL